MEGINLQVIEEWYSENYASEIHGLRVLFRDIKPLIEDLNSEFETSILGTSENDIPIHKIKLGNESKRILIWSQMHGNESTGTKAMFDLFQFFSEKEQFQELKSQILSNCTLIFVPMLNPDGAIKYTRENSQNIDLNRDAVDLKAKESRLLRSLLDEFNPHFCFNLHDQRTIFNVSGTKNPATLSFLAPSIDVERTITQGRTETMSVIVAMNKTMQKLIPYHIGRYTDEFYPTATGDNFQKLGHNTILIEAGHFPDDYEREKVRMYNFIALLQGLEFIATTNTYKQYKEYFDIPNNDNLFLDIIYENALIDSKKTSLGVLFKYKVIDDELVMYESVEKTGDLKKFFAHKVIDLKNKHYQH